MKGIVKLIHDNGGTVTGAAKSAGVSSVQIYNYNKGRNTPSLQVAADLAGYLGVDIEDLVRLPA